MTAGSHETVATIPDHGCTRSQHCIGCTVATLCTDCPEPLSACKVCNQIKLCPLFQPEQSWKAQAKIKQVKELHYQGYNTRQIAGIMGISIMTTQKYLRASITHC